MSTQTAFDNFYCAVVRMLETCYQDRSFTVASCDHECVTPGLKSTLRRKNRLRRAGRVDETGALPKQISEEIVRNSKSTLTRFNGRSDAKEMWRAVNIIFGQRRLDESAAVGIADHSLNEHFANVLSDLEY
jgi:hypothetical protein